MNTINQLHSVRFRNKGFKRKVILKPEQRQEFEAFLITSLGKNVFLLSTALGLDVIYLSKTDKTNFIIKEIALFQPQLKFQEMQIKSLKAELVLEDFSRIVTTLSGHPQLFLSCCKRLVSKFNASGLKTPLYQLLYNCFDEELKVLISENKLPYASKIKRLRENKEEPFLKADKLSGLLNKYRLKSETLKN